MMFLHARQRLQLALRSVGGERGGKVLCSWRLVVDTGACGCDRPLSRKSGRPSAGERGVAGRSGMRMVLPWQMAQAMCGKACVKFGLAGEHLATWNP